MNFLEPRNLAVILHQYDIKELDGHMRYKNHPAYDYNKMYHGMAHLERFISSLTHVFDYVRLQKSVRRALIIAASFHDFDYQNIHNDALNVQKALDAFEEFCESSIGKRPWFSGTLTKHKENIRFWIASSQYPYESQSTDPLVNIFRDCDHTMYLYEDGLDFLHRLTTIEWGLNLKDPEVRKSVHENFLTYVNGLSFNHRPFQKLFERIKPDLVTTRIEAWLKALE